MGDKLCSSDHVNVLTTLCTTSKQNKNWVIYSFAHLIHITVIILNNSIK